jgi:L-fuconolactonase
MKIDAHQHFWRYRSSEYSWINDEMQALKRDFLPEELGVVLNSTGFSGSIAVQARQSLVETRWLLSLADQYDFIKGIVGWVDLCSPLVDEQLEELAQHPKLVGIRHVVQDEPDENFMLKEHFLRGISLLKKYKLVYDLLIVPRQMAVAIDLVRLFPDQQFVLDHIAKPDIKANVIKPWQKEIKKLAACNNVACKLSGMVTEADWHQWKNDDFRPYLDIVFEAFGINRLMIGSDWPVCTLAGSYQSVMKIVIDYIKNMSPNEKNLIFSCNASKIYNLTTI